MRAARRICAGALERPAMVAVVVLTVGAMVVVLGLTGTGVTKARETAAKPVKQIGVMKADGLRVELVAERSGRQGAIVRVAAFRHRDGNWKRLGPARRVGSETWLWRVVTRRGGIRALQMRVPDGPAPLGVAVRLLYSPSIGPSERFLFAVRGGRLRPVGV
jgi:hypothetical protein